MSGGWYYTVLFHSVKFVMTVERLILFKMVKLSNLDCLCSATNMTDLY